MKNLPASPPSPPARLSPEAKKWWGQIIAEYGIDDPGGLLILGTALEAFTRMREAQRGLKKQGLSFVDRFGQVKANPLSVIERDSRGQMLAALKQLNLDIEPLQDRPGRPNGR